MMNRPIISHPMRWKSEKTKSSRICLKNVRKVGNILSDEGRIVFAVSRPPQYILCVRETDLNRSGKSAVTSDCQMEHSLRAWFANTTIYKWSLSMVSFFTLPVMQGQWYSYWTVSLSLVWVGNIPCTHDPPIPHFIEGHRPFALAVMKSPSNLPIPRGLSPMAITHTLPFKEYHEGYHPWLSFALRFQNPSKISNTIPIPISKC